MDKKFTDARDACRTSGTRRSWTERTALAFVKDNAKVLVVDPVRQIIQVKRGSLGKKGLSAADYINGRTFWRIVG